MDRFSRRVASASDRLLDFLVLAFAAWTAIYHACLILHLGTAWAAAAGAVALLPCGWLALMGNGTGQEARPDADILVRSRSRVPGVPVVHLLTAVAAAALFASRAPWPVVWPLWLIAAGAGVILTRRRAAGPIVPSRPEKTPSEGSPADASSAWPATLVVLTWALGLATLSLFLVAKDADDAQYVHFSSWVAAHGRFPLRDTLFSDEGFPAIIFPPLSSFEGLAGTVARGTGLSVPDLVYLGVTPLASALSVLAIWRLLRSWGVPRIGLGLSVAVVFLLLDGEHNRTLGNLFIGRIWQGKIVFLAVLVPVLFVLLAEYVNRPGRRQLALVTAAGAAGVGLTSTAVFLIPVIAAGCLGLLARRAPKQAAVGLIGAVAYPLAAAGVTAAVGARNADVSSNSEIVSGILVRFVFGDGVVAVVAVTAALVAPVLIPRASASRMTAATVLLVTFLYAPQVPLLVYHLTGLGEVLWRLTWAVPTAALVGVLATALGARIRAPALRVAPAILLGAALAVGGTPVWSAVAGTTLAARPEWKRPAESIEAAQRILAHARPGDSVLAPHQISQTILVMSGTVTTVAPRAFYARALRDVPGTHANQRLLLLWFAESGLGPVEEGRRRTVEALAVVHALRTVDVDIACVADGEPGARRLLLASGYSPFVTSTDVSCFRAPPRAP